MLGDETHQIGVLTRDWIKKDLVFDKVLHMGTWSGPQYPVQQREREALKCETGIRLLTSDGVWTIVRRRRDSGIRENRLRHHSTGTQRRQLESCQSRQWIRSQQQKAVHRSSCSDLFDNEQKKRPRFHSKINRDQISRKRDVVVSSKNLNSKEETICKLKSKMDR